MRYFWQILYNILFLPLLYILAIIISLFNRKVREGFSGRRKAYSTLRKYFSGKRRDELVYWFHSASHGEYEQIRPVLAGLKHIEPNSMCVVSFFSPSGYRNVSDPNIDCKIYLPVDFYWNCWRLLRLVRPHKLIFAEYDIWPNYVWCAKRLNIKTTLFSARIQKKSKKLYPVIRSLYKHVYKCIDSIYTISENDHINIRRLVGKRKGAVIRVLGSPRYDRVKEIADKTEPGRIQTVLERNIRLIAGSVRPEDENAILPTLFEIMRDRVELSLYWVPHEPGEKILSRSIKMFDEAGFSFKRFSECINGDLQKMRTIIVDKVGVLAELYWHGRYAYIGGGFSTGLHNVMEPAIARLPIIFGPKYHNSDAAEELVTTGGGFCITTGDEFRSIFLRLMDDKEFFLKSSAAATAVIHRNVGSATRVVRGIIRD